MLVTEFYKDKDLFITGASGFIGKALIEKLLRSCPEIGNIYVLIRGKKGKNAEDRVREIMHQPLFDTLHKEHPDAWRKVRAIEGDCMALGLGIKPDDLEKLQNVSIIVHSAASVRFDDALRDAILMNTRGTHELVKIAETMKNLKVFLHVSTTYSNPAMHVVEEKVYPPLADWRTTIKLAESHTTETLNILNLKYSNYQPNTYTFTKSLSEQIINDYRDKLPVLIFRPSIVVSAINEPAPGWTDNYNGPVGLLVACGVGIMRTSYGDPDIEPDFVPIDICVRALIVACYRRGLAEQQQKTIRDTSKLEVINCAINTIRSISTREILELGTEYIKNNPLEKTLWVPGGSITKCIVWNWIRFITLHILMAILIDCALRLTKAKPFLLKTQRRIYAANLALHYFICTAWIFKNENFVELEDAVPQSELEKFSFMMYTNVEVNEYFTTAIRGAKKFLLNEPPDSTPAARRRMKIFGALHFLIQWIGGLLIARFLIRFMYRKLFLGLA